MYDLFEVLNACNIFGTTMFIYSHYVFIKSYCYLLLRKPHDFSLKFHINLSSVIGGLGDNDFVHWLGFGDVA